MVLPTNALDHNVRKTELKITFQPIAPILLHVRLNLLRSLANKSKYRNDKQSLRRSYILP